MSIRSQPDLENAIYDAYTHSSWHQLRWKWAITSNLRIRFDTVWRPKTQFSAQNATSRWVYAVSRARKTPIASSIRTLADTNLRWKGAITSNLRIGFGTVRPPKPSFSAQNDTSRWVYRSTTRSAGPGLTGKWQSRLAYALLVPSIWDENGQSRATCALLLARFGHRKRRFQPKTPLHNFCENILFADAGDACRPS